MEVKGKYLMIIEGYASIRNLPIVINFHKILNSLMVSISQLIVIQQSTSQMASEFFKTVYPIYIVSKWSSFALFTIDPKDLSVRISKFDILMQIIFAALNIILNVIFWTSCFSISIYDSHITNAALPVMLYGSFTIYTFCMFWSVFRRKMISQILKKFKEIDWSLSFLQINFNYHQQKVFAWKLLIGTLSTSTFIVIFGSFLHWFYGLGMNARIDIFFLWGVYCGSLLVAQYNLTIAAIRKRFRAVNMYIKSFKANMMEQEIQHLAKVHRNLSDTIILVNKVLSPMIMLFIAISFVWICIWLFSITNVPHDVWQRYPLLVTSRSAIHICMSLLAISCIWISESTTEEGTKTIRNLYDILSDANSKRDVSNDYH